MTAVRIAARHPVTGWVRNEPDRSVVMEIQGIPEDIARCLSDLRAVMRENITDESSQPLPTEPGESSFVIRR